MLLKNGTRYELSQEQKDEVLSKFDRFPVILRIHTGLKRWDDENKRFRTPPLLMVQTTSMAEIDGSSDNYTYATNVKKVDGDLVATNNTLDVSGSITVQKSNIEFLWWLYNCCPRISNNKLKSTTPYWEFEKKDETAKEVADKKRREAAVYKYLYDTDGLNNSQLIMVAKAFLVNTENVSPDEIRTNIEAKVNSGSGEEIDLLVSRCKEAMGGSKSDLLENTVNNAISQEIIVADTKRWGFYFKDEDGEVGSLFSKVKPTKDMPKALLEVMRNKPALIETLERELEASKRSSSVE